MKRMNAPATRDENNRDAHMNAVIIYDRFEIAAKANAVLERATHRTGETVNWNVKPWRVDMLNLRLTAEAALAEAAEAHLIVVAVREVQALLVDWLERWATCRHVQEAALAVWDGGNADTRRTREIPELSRFARRHGLSLLLDDMPQLMPKQSSNVPSQRH
jgi:hypothetical protein